MPLRWRTSARRGFAAVVAVVLAALLVGLLIDQVSWSRTDGAVRSFDADVRVRPDGTIRVTETVRLRFDSSERAPSEQRVIRTYAQGRQLEVSGVQLVGEGDRELRPEVVELLGERRLRFDLPGDPQDPQRRYVLSYTVAGSSTPLSGQTLLEHDLLARGLGREVGTARVTIRGAGPDTAGCLTGPPDRRRFCALTDLTATQVVLGEKQLAADDGLAFSVRFEPALPEVSPANEAAPPVANGTIVLVRTSLVLALLLVIGTVAMLRQRSRPRSWLRQFRGTPEPPVGVRPGEAGALLAGAAAPGHLTATLYDLVRRGHLRMHGTGEHAILRQPAPTGSRDELQLYEWSLLLKIFSRKEDVSLAEVRRDAPNWSYELLRELERQVTEGSGWRRSDRATLLQRLGWLVAMGIVLLGYVTMAVLAVTGWPELPIRDLVAGAVVTILWSAGCAELASRVAPGALTLRGRLVFADVDAWARYVDRRGVDDDNPAMGIWAVALGVRPDPIGLPVVPPADRPPRQHEDDLYDDNNDHDPDPDDRDDPDSHDSYDDLHDSDGSGGPEHERDPERGPDHAYPDPNPAGSRIFDDDDDPLP